MVRSAEIPVQAGESRYERGRVNLRTVAHNLYGEKIFDWDKAFGISNQNYITFKPAIGRVRLDFLRSFQAELNVHKEQYEEAKEHLVTETLGRFGEFKSLVVDGLEIPFISLEVEFMIREMLGGSPMSKKNYLDHMEKRNFKNAEDILRDNIDFMNKYLHLGLTLHESRINGGDKYTLQMPKRTKVKFGNQSKKAIKK